MRCADDERDKKLKIDCRSSSGDAEAVIEVRGSRAVTFSMLPRYHPRHRRPEPMPVVKLTLTPAAEEAPTAVISLPVAALQGVGADRATR